MSMDVKRNTNNPFRSPPSPPYNGAGPSATSWHTDPMSAQPANPFDARSSPPLPPLPPQAGPQDLTRAPVNALNSSFANDSNFNEGNGRPNGNGQGAMDSLAADLQATSLLETNALPSEPPPAYSIAADSHQGEATLELGPRRPFQPAPTMPTPSFQPPFNQQYAGAPQGGHYQGQWQGQNPSQGYYTPPPGPPIPSMAGPSYPPPNSTQYPAPPGPPQGGSGWSPSPAIPSRASSGFAPPPPPRHPASRGRTEPPRTPSRIAAHPPSAHSSTLSPVNTGNINTNTHLSDFARDFYASAEPHQFLDVGSTAPRMPASPTSSDGSELAGPEQPVRVLPPERTPSSARMSFSPPSGPPPGTSSLNRAQSQYDYGSRKSPPPSSPYTAPNYAPNDPPPQSYSSYYTPPSGPPSSSYGPSSSHAPPMSPGGASLNRSSSTATAMWNNNDIGTGEASNESFEPTSTPIPGQPLMRKGRVLIYPTGYECKKCLNTGYKDSDPAHPCKKCWEKYSRPYSASLARAPTTFQRPLPSSTSPSGAPTRALSHRYTQSQSSLAPGGQSPQGPGRSQSLSRPSNSAQGPQSYASYPISPYQQSYAPPSGPPGPPGAYGQSGPPGPPGAGLGRSLTVYHGMPPPDAQVVNPGDPRIGGSPCYKCHGEGMIVQFFIKVDKCPVCNGLGRIFQ